MNIFLFVIIISLLGPVIGSLIGVLKRPSKPFVFNMLSFSAGVMLAISFMELIPESIRIYSIWMTLLGILVGAFCMYIVERLIPHFHIWASPKGQCSKMQKTALFLIFGIFIHNFPEGMAIGLGGATDIKMSLIIALAIALHDIPESICTAAPYYYCTGKRLRSFLVSASTAIPTVIGFLLTYFLYSLIPASLIGFLVAFTAGVMIYISAEELIPTSCRKVSEHRTEFSFILGVLLVILLGAL